MTLSKKWLIGQFWPENPVIIPSLRAPETPKGYGHSVTSKIVKRKTKWCVVSEKSGRNLGCYPTKEKAVKRLRQVEYFKRHAYDLEQIPLHVPSKFYHEEVAPPDPLNPPKHPTDIDYKNTHTYDAYELPFFEPPAKPKPTTPTTMEPGDRSEGTYLSHSLTPWKVEETKPVPYPHSPTNAPIE